MDAVVKVYCVHTEPNYSLPWQRKRQFASTSTGFLIDAGGDGQRWLLTNAHSVEYHSQVPDAPGPSLLVIPCFVRLIPHAYVCSLWSLTLAAHVPTAPQCSLSQDRHSDRIHDRHC